MCRLNYKYNVLLKRESFALCGIYLAGLTIVSNSVERCRLTYDLAGGMPRALARASELKVGSKTSTAPWTPDSFKLSAYSWKISRYF